MNIRPSFGAGIASLALLTAFYACSGGKDSREASTGKAVDAEAAQATQAAAGATTAGGDDAAAIGSQDEGQVASDSPNSGQAPADTRQAKTLEDCQGANQAWRAVVDNGQSPADCVDTLVTWCCTTDEIEARFKDQATNLKAKFDDIIGTQGLVLYACSVDATNKYTFHMAKITGGSTLYQTVYISNEFPADTGSGVTQCTKATTQDLIKG